MDYLLPMCQGRIKPGELPIISPRTIYFFVCSAYTDFSVERCILQESVYYDIRKYSQEKYGLDVCFIDPRPLEDTLPLEPLGYVELFRNLSLQYCRNDLNCCPIILLGQRHGLPLLPKRIPASIFDCLTHRMKQKASNLCYTILQEIDLTRWYHLDSSVVGEPQWCLNSMDYLGNKLENQPVENRKKIIEEWNQARDTIAWIFYHIGNLCLRENLITEQDFNMLFLTEFPSTLSSLIKSTEVNYDNFMDYQTQTHSELIPVNTDWIFSDPAVLHREIIDIQHYIKEEQSIRKFIDIMPQLTSDPNITMVNFLPSNVLKHQSSINHLLQGNLQTLTKRLLQKITYSNASFEDQVMKVLWRSPHGIDRKFHADYLSEFVSRVRKLAHDAIDRRASTKTALMLPNLSLGSFKSHHTEIAVPLLHSQEEADSPISVPEATIILPQIQNEHTYAAREFQKRITLWDNVWNALNYVDWLIPIGSSYKNEIETLLCYVEDTDPAAQVPMLVYSTSEVTNKTDEEQFCLANAVAACCFQEVQSRLSMESTTISYLLEYTQSQL
ncbi:unnamed protein product [Heterobilharzia americana]|nr:unnamed protein product [Heterobilharzia americana]